MNRRARPVSFVLAALLLPALGGWAVQPPLEPSLVPRRAAPARLELPRFLPGSVLVRLKDSVGVDAEAWFRGGKPFRRVTADKSGSLDALFQRFDVRGVHAVFRTVPPGLETAPVAVAALKQGDDDELYHIYRLDLGPGIDAQEAAAEMGADPHVVFAEPNGLAEMQGLPNDTLIDPDGDGAWNGRPEYGYADLWSLERTGWGQVWAQQASIWPSAARRGGGGVVVAVIDSGVDVRHGDLRANVWHDAQNLPGYDFVDVDVKPLEAYGLTPVSGEDYRKPDGDPADHYGHGTHVAGIIAAAADNRKGIAGVAWKSKVMPVRAGFVVQDGNLRLYGLLSTDAIAAGIQYAVRHGAQVINMSFGSGGPEQQTEAAALRFARSRGVLLVAAAGNGDSDARDVYPAANPDVLAVGATLPNDHRVAFSNWGTTVAIAAPGTDIVSLRAAGTNLGGIYGDAGPGCTRLSGTSMAAPQVSGALALILSAFPGITREQATQRLLAAADPVPEAVSRAGRLFVQGSGRLNVLRALKNPLKPVLSLRSLRVEDENRNGAIEPGEHAALQIEIRNVGKSAHGVTIDLHVTDANVTGHWAFADWPAGSTRTLTATLDVFPSLPWGETGDPRLSIHGDSLAQTDQIIVLPLAVPGLAPKAGWPIKGLDMAEGLVSSPVLGDLDGDGKLEAVYQSINGTIYARHADGGLLPGWPVKLPGAFEQASPLLADLNGDGTPEVLLAAGGKIHVLDVQGRELAGWPQAVPFLYSASLAVGDVTGDGKPDVVAMSDHAELYVLSAAGALQAGWPRTLGSFGGTTPLLVDLDGSAENGSALEILTGASEGKLTAWRGDGTPAAGDWPADLGSIGPASPAAADLDGDGKLDVVAVSSFGFVGRLDSRGDVIWRRLEPGVAGFSSPALGDLDGDGRLDIVLGSFDSSSEGFVTAFDPDGNILPGWPVYTAAPVDASPALADLDGDGRPEVLVADSSGLFYAFHGDGSPVAGWPHDMQDTSQVSPVVADLDGDGVLEAFSGVFHLGLNTAPIDMIFALECGPASSSSRSTRAPWPAFKNNARRTGVQSPPPP